MVQREEDTVLGMNCLFICEKNNMHCNVPSGIFKGGINYDDEVTLLPMMIIMMAKIMMMMIFYYGGEIRNNSLSPA